MLILENSPAVEKQIQVTAVIVILTWFDQLGHKMGIKNIQNILSEIWKICSCTSSVLYTLCSIHCVKEYLFIPQILESTYR